MQDELVEHHQKFGAFPGEMKIMKPRILPLINWFFWFLVLIKFLVGVLKDAIADDNYIAITSFFFVLIALYFGFSLIKKQSMIRGSGSQYGKQRIEKDKNNN